jgi:coproporphyrinogen III oxidase-like Fe-S oxidoreductase
MLGMRLSRGVDFNALEKEHGSVVKVYEKGLEKYISGGFVVKKDCALAFTDKGAYVSNYILSDILDFEEKN